MKGQLKVQQKYSTYVPAKYKLFLYFFNFAMNNKYHVRYMYLCKFPILHYILLPLVHKSTCSLFLLVGNCIQKRSAILDTYFNITGNNKNNLLSLNVYLYMAKFTYIIVM